MKEKHWTDAAHIHIPYHKSPRYVDAQHHCSPHRLNRHIVLEKCFDFLCKPASIFLRGYIYNEAKRKAFNLNNLNQRRLIIFKLMKVPFNILNGRNCEYPPRHTALYIVSLLRKKGLK